MVKIKTTKMNKVIGYCTPVKQHNVGRQLARKVRKEYVI